MQIFLFVFRRFWQLQTPGFKRVNAARNNDRSCVEGESVIENVTLRNVKTNEETKLDFDGVIVNFGFVSSLGPITDWGLNIEHGSIIVDSRMESSIPGIFAAGDVTTYPGKVKLITVGFEEAPTAVNNAKVYFDPGAKLSLGHSSNMKF